MRSRLLPSLALWLLVCATVVPQAQQLRKIGEMELALVGLSATVDGARPAIPKNVASGVRILISGGGATLSPATAARLLGPFDVEAELSGPSFGETVTVRHSVTPASSEANLILPLPAMAVSGEHTLANLRIVNPAQHPILDLQPRMVPVDVVEQVLITSVRTRPLTLQEIRDKGIVLDSDDYLGFEFTLGVLLESKPVNLSFPVVFDRQGIAVPVPESLPSLDVDSLQEPLPVPKLIPMMLKASSKLGPGSAIDFPEEDIRIPSLLVIPGEVGYLKQFFSAQLFVGNGTPATANLTVRDLTGTLQLPDNPDSNSPDPLSLAETVNGIQPTTMTIAAVGPDGKSGTADDKTALRAGEQGMAEFLVRGDLEGFHNLIFDIKGTLDGLATGPLEVTGHAKGGVLVRNPFFDISFTLPTVVRAQEPFKLYATVTNKGEGIANDVTMSLDGASLSGLEPIGDTSKSITTLKPGQAETLVFDFKSLRTGQAVATYLRFNGDGAAGSIRFKVGVGERGVPLSPDTLVLPASVDELPPDVIASAMRVLGQAWSIANTPPNAVPTGVIRISKALVTSKALALAEAGLRVRLGQEATTAVRDLLPDFYGPVPVDRGFDQLLRTTDAGRNFTRAIGAFIATTAVSASALEEEFARIAASGRDFVSFSIASGNQGADVAVRLTDAGGRALVYTGSDDDPRPAIASAAIAPLGPPQDSPLFGLIAAPTAMPYTLELTGRNGDAIDLSITYPRGDGSFTRLAASGVAIAANARARLVIDPARASPSIEIDTDGNGSVDTTTPLFPAPITATGPRFLSASVVGPETLSSAGPYGFNVAILFDRVVDEAAATDRARYAIPDNQFHSVRRQLSGRLVFGTLALPEGPYVPSAVTVSGMPDLRGVMSGNETQPLQSLLEDAGAVVSGRVINGEGQVASGVRVLYWANPSWLDCDTSIPPKPFAAAITDAQGRYRFNYVYRDRCGMAWRMNALDETRNSERSVYGLVRTAGERVTADIALLGRGSVSGIVRNAAGAPVAGAQVIVVSTLESQVGGGAITDGDGRYTVTGVTVGPVSITAAKGGDVGAAAGRIARAGTTAFADVTLSGGSVTISGVVRTSENGVLALATGATVVYEAANPLASGSIITGVATAGSDGRYEFSGMPKGNFAIRARLATGDFVHLPGIAVADQVITNFDVVIEVKRSGRVSGVVRFPDGSPAPGSVVTLSSRGVRGEQDGTFSIEGVEVAARSQSVRATSSDGLREGQAEVLVSEFGQHVSNVIVTLNGIGTLDLLVIDSAGNPVRNQIVQIARTGHNISPTDCTAFYLAPTDDQGRVQFAGLEVGAVRAVAIRATATGVDIAKLDSAIPYEGSSVSGVLRFGGGGILSGTIRDDQGAPVLGANIEVHSKVYQPGICGFMPGVSHRVRTDVNGRYRVTGVPVGHVNVTASQEFFPTPVGAGRVLAHDGDELVVDLKLVHTISEKLTGYVFLPDGVTPAGAGVSVTASGGLPDVVVTTNDAGFFAFPRILPASAYLLTAADPGTGFVAQQRVVLKIAQTPDAIVRHDVRLKGKGTVRIQVVDGGGVPVSNAHVTLKESQFPREIFEGVVEPSNQGVVTFTHVHEGSFSVSASDVFGRGGRISGDLPNDGATANITVQLTVTGNVTGRFLMPDGVTPIPLGTIQLLANNRVIGQSTTESGENSGAFAFSYVPAGTVRLEGLDPATGRMGVAVGQLVTDNQDLTLDVKVQGLGTVTGVVTSNGATQGGAHVTVSSGSFKATTTADGAGRYTVPGVPEGAVTVKADLDGALPSSAIGTLIGEDTTITVDVALQPSGAVTGTVRRSDGSIAPASIVTINVGGTRYSVTTNQDGDYQFDLIPAGTRVVSVDVIGSIDTATVTAMIHGGQINDIPIQLTGVGGISGLARDANGNPVGGTVSVTGNGWSTTVTVNPDGTFSLSPVLAGPFSAQVRHSSGSATLYGTATGVVMPGETASIAVTLQPTGEIRGVVLRADGATPAVGATLTLTGGGNSIVRQAFSAGEFSFAGLPLGTYALKIYDATTDGHARALGVVLAQNGDVKNAGTLVLDNTTLVVQSITPADGALGVSRTQPIVVTYSDPVISFNGVNVKDAAGNIGAGRELSADGRTLTLTGTWTDSAQITVEVTTSVADIFGRHIATVVTSRFTTVDTTAPSATLSPANGAYEVSVNAAIVATFTEPVVNASLEGLITVSRAGVPVSGVTIRGPSNVLTFTPAAPLGDNSSYTATVVGAVDASGNQQVVPKTATFLTTDTIAPVIFITSPGQSGWLSDATPGIVFQRGDGIGSGIDTASGSLSIDGVAVTPTSKTSTHIVYNVPASAPLSDGTHTISATTADNAGNVAPAQGVARIDTTAPSAATITTAGTGPYRAGQIAITAEASDTTSGVQKIQVYRNESFIVDLPYPTFENTWNTASVADGQYTLTARAIDHAGNAGPFGDPFTIVIVNHFAVVTIDSPIAGFKTRRPVAVAASVDEAVQRVDFTLGGVTITDTTPPYSAMLPVNTVPTGNATLTVQAYGFFGELSTATRVIEIDRSTPVARWPFDDGAGLSATDATGNGFNGTLVNGPAWVTFGQFGKALSFDGLDDGVSVDHSEDFDAQTGLTLSAWVSPQSFGSPQSVIYRNAAYSLSILGDGRVRAVAYPGGGATVLQSPAAIPPQTWSHVGATYDQSTLRLFVNGLEVASAPAAGALATSNSNVWLGRADSVESLNGQLDEARIYDRAFTAAEMLALGTPPVIGSRMIGSVQSSFVAKPGGPVWSFGREYQGDLGQGGATASVPRPLPTAIAGLTDVIDIAAGDRHVLLLASTGTVFVSGDRESEALGISGTGDVLTPVALGLDSIVAVAAGSFHSLALRSNGDVYSWGSNAKWQQGNTGTAATLLPQVIMTGVKAIAAGEEFSLFIKTDGTVWGLGDDQMGQLGSGSTATQRSTPVQMSGITTAVELAAGRLHSMIRLSNGTVKGAGRGAELGVGSQGVYPVPTSVNITGVVRLSAGRNHTLALKNDSTVWGWGFDSHGALDGLEGIGGNNAIRLSPVRLAKVPLAVDIGAGWNHSFAVTDDGVVWAWGENAAFEIGDGGLTHRLSPVTITADDYAWKVLTPRIGLNSGTYDVEKVTSVTNEMPDAEMRYTIDGSEPTPDAVLVVNNSVTITSTQTLRVKAFKNGMPPSNEDSRVYTLQPGLPTLSPASGTNLAGTVAVQLTPSGTGTLVCYTIGTASLPPAEPTVNSVCAASETIELTGSAQIKARTFKDGWTPSATRTGTYSFKAPTPVLSHASGTYAGPLNVTLSAPLQGATFRWSTTLSSISSCSAGNAYTGPISISTGQTLRARTCRIDYDISSEVSATYTVTLAAPLFSLESGTYAPGTAVTITGDPGLVIRYSVDGSDPTATHPSIASGTSLVLGNFTLKARAFVPGGAASAATSADYAISGPLTPFQVGAGVDHSLAVFTDGRVYTWGDNVSGQLGRGSSGGTRLLPALLNAPGGIVAVAAGFTHSLLITANGQLWAVGSNGNGQLGDGTTTQRNSVVQVASLSTVVAAAAGQFHSAALLANGDVYTWGLNTSGQLGDGTTQSSSLPRLVMSGVRAVAAGATHTLLLKVDGTVWATGLNSFGQLGDGTTIARSTPVQMLGISGAVQVAGGLNFSVVRLESDTLRATGENSAGQLGDGTGTQRLTPVAVGLTGVIDVRATINHTLALKTDGTVWAWGYGLYGRVGDGTTTSRQSPVLLPGLSNVIKIAAGGGHSLAVAIDGSVYAWGKGDMGAVGDGVTADHLVPTPISIANMHWKTPSPTLTTLGGTFTNTTSTTVGAIAALPSDPQPTIRVTLNGADPTETDPAVAVGTVLPITKTQTVSLRAFRAGMPPSNIERQTYSLQPGIPALNPASASNLTGTFKLSRTVGANGTSVRYTIGTASQPPEEPTATNSFLFPDVGIELTASAQIKAKTFKDDWTPSATRTGTYSFKAPVPVPSHPQGSYVGTQNVTLSSPLAGATFRWSISLSTITSCTAGTLYTGPIPIGGNARLVARTCHADYNVSDELIANYTLTAAAPTFSVPQGTYAPGTQVTINADPTTSIIYTIDGSDPTTSSTGLATAPGATLFVGNYTIKALAYKPGNTTSAVSTADYALTTAMSTGIAASGSAHGVIATPDGRVFTWGENPLGQLGNGTFSFRAIPGVLNDLTGVVALSALSRHNLAVTFNGDVYAWGHNSSGQLGDGSTTGRNRPVRLTALSNIVQVSAAFTHSLALSASGQVFAWGSGASGQLGYGGNGTATLPMLVPGLPTIAWIAAGDNTSYAVTTDGRVYAWGSDRFGQIGDGGGSADVANELSPKLIAGVSNVESLSVTSHVLARTRDGRLFAWGANDFDQIDSTLEEWVWSPTELAGGAPAQMSAGAAHSMTMGSDGTLRAWGWNSYGELGDGTNEPKVAPVVVNVPPGASTFQVAERSTVVMPSGAVWTWGNSRSGLYFGDGVTANRFTPQFAFHAGDWWAPAAPTFSVVPGTYSTAVTLALTAPAAGATIRYTLDGSTPDDSSPEVPATGEVLINSTATIRARVFVPGRKPGAITAGTYVIQP